MAKDNVVISTRIPKQTLVEIRKSVNKDYTSESDFFRSAIRSELFKQKITEIKQDLEKTQNSDKAVRDLRDLLEKANEEDYETWVQEETKHMK